jgi:hypothetical protein
MTPFRARMLRKLHIKGYGPGDVTAVMEELKRRIKNKPQIYDESSLEFGAAIANTEKFDDRAKILRTLAAKKTSASPRKSAAPARAALSTQDQDRLFAEGARELAEFRRKFGRGTK